MFTVSSTLIWAVITGPTDWVCHIGTLKPGMQAWSERLTGLIVPEMTYNVWSGTLSNQPTNLLLVQLGQFRGFMRQSRLVFKAQLELVHPQYSELLPGIYQYNFGQTPDLFSGIFGSGGSRRGATKSEQLKACSLLIWTFERHPTTELFMEANCTF